MFKSSYEKRSFKLSSMGKSEKETKSKLPLNRRVVFDSLSGMERRASSKVQFLYVILLLMIASVFFFVGGPSTEVELIKVDDSLIEKR